MTKKYTWFLSGAAISFTFSLTAQGNVGIGLTDPLSILHSRINANPLAMPLARTGLCMDNSDMTGTLTEPSNVMLLFAENGNPKEGIEGGTFGYDYLKFYTASDFSIHKMIIDHDGNVGIGITSPTSRLHVSGSIKANSLTASGSIWSGNLVDTDDPAYFMDLSSTGTSINTPGGIVSAYLTDANNSAYFIDPSFPGISLNTAGGLKSPYFSDADNSAYYLDPSSNSVSLKAAGGIEAFSFLATGSIYSGSAIQTAGFSEAVDFRDWNDDFYVIDPNGYSKMKNLHLFPGNGGLDNNSGLKIKTQGAFSWTINAYPGSDYDLGFWYGSLPRAYLQHETDAGALDFTAQHRTLPGEGLTEDYRDKEGYIVVSNGEIINLNGSIHPSIMESLPRVKLSDQAMDKRVYGVVAGIEYPVEGDDKNTRSYSHGAFVTVTDRADSSDYRLIINAAGEGGIWVSNYNGDIRNGDLITSSPISGIGMKQDDDLLHSYTVCKVVMDCSFELNAETYKCREVIYKGKTYRMAFLGCVYLCN